jgi:hypothetical protein
MRKLHAICSVALFALAALATTACGSDDEGENTEYASLQACVDDLKMGEDGKDTRTSIAECIGDKTLGGMKLSFATKEECVTYVTANTTGFMPNAIDGGCQLYIDAK